MRIRISKFKVITSEQNIFEFHKWFAWYPVIAIDAHKNKYFCWFSEIYRKRIGHSMGNAEGVLIYAHWVYRCESESF